LVANPTAALKVWGSLCTDRGSIGTHGCGEKLGDFSFFSFCLHQTHDGKARPGQQGQAARPRLRARCRLASGLGCILCVYQCHHERFLQSHLQDLTEGGGVVVNLRSVSWPCPKQWAYGAGLSHDGRLSSGCGPRQWLVKFSLSWPGGPMSPVTKRRREIPGGVHVAHQTVIHAAGWTLWSWDSGTPGRFQFFHRRVRPAEVEYVCKVLSVGPIGIARGAKRAPLLEAVRIPSTSAASNVLMSGQLLASTNWAASAKTTAQWSTGRLHVSL